jgi:hypothetical protein
MACPLSLQIIGTVRAKLRMNQLSQDVLIAPGACATYCLDELRQLLGRTRLAAMAESLMVFDLKDHGYQFRL